MYQALDAGFRGSGGGGSSLRKGLGGFFFFRFSVARIFKRLPVHIVIRPNVKTLSGGEFGWGGTSVKR